MKHPYLPKLLFLLLFVCAGFTSALAQTGSISGRIVDEKSQGIPGVTVLIEGTSLGTSTNSDGQFSIQNVPAGPQTIVASFVGFTTTRRPVTISAGQNATLDVSLSENTTLLNEAVVIGYGTQRRQDLTGAVEQISEKQFVKGQVTNPEQLIQGKVAGLQVTTGGGAPGTGSSIRIRGGSSLSASNDPLIVIDGVPVDNQGISGAANPLSLINPNDIESITVLKDASSTAIYGSRASNGVILVTTKRGLQGEKLTVNVSSQNSISEAVKYIDVLNGAEYRALVNSRGNAQQKAQVGTANTDWQKEIFRTAQTTDNNVSIAGSAGPVPFRVSGGYLDQEGLLINNDLKRYTGSISLTPVLLDSKLRVTLNLKGSWIDNNFSDGGAVAAAVFYDPTQPVYSSNPLLAKYGGYYQNLDVNGNINTLSGRNPVGLINQRRDRSTVKRSIGNIQLDYRLPFVDGLSANLNVGYDIQRGRGSVYVAPNSATFVGDRLGKGQNNPYAANNDNKLLEAYLKYDKEIGIGRLELLAGHSYQAFDYKTFVFDDFTAAGEVFIPATMPINGKDYTDPGYRLLSFYGRANYNIKDKYLFTGTFRADGSSRFPDNNRWGYFPSGAFAWRIKGEDFLANNSVVSDLKLRFGYGQTGQQDLGTSVEGLYGYLALYTPSQNTASYQLGDRFYTTSRPSFYNLQRKWETTTTYNVGLDYGFIDNRISGSVDVYQRDTKDLLNFIEVAALANLSNAGNFNVGSMTNKGVEAIVNVDVLRGEKLNWSLNLNGNYNQNEITRLTLVESPNYIGVPTGGIGGGVGNNIQINSVGYPANSFYVYQQVYGTDGKPLEGVYVDRNKDGVVNGSDRYRYKSSRPKYILGFGSNLSYGKASLAFTMRSSLDNYMYNNLRSGSTFSANSTGFLSNATHEVLNSQFSTAQYFSDYYMENASYLRMENITLGYNVGKIAQDKANVNLSLSVQNAFVITDYTGLDPEVFNGIDNSIYPRPRTFTLGLNIGF
ncbi:SusC/RagA family TonB-linked outer membrane protein [Hymenobacter guriensis]|uniref:SusC/RagA family TonB-linked outer membrane protein n=1 Tax=Hymenobacter guriensis TaxID=2793065 RepID=A0ABS0L443_9BACT|nr:SusC/RagA family TonB-linked outer membrane protein [Hymenobacter guriensis]MBG8554904.1 SusC/RagA family TonB-linked outer membrane protein [Hymenobacter guriensis]